MLNRLSLDRQDRGGIQFSVVSIVGKSARRAARSSRALSLAFDRFFSHSNTKNQFVTQEDHSDSKHIRQQRHHTHARANISTSTGVPRAQPFHGCNRPSRLKGGEVHFLTGPFPSFYSYNTTTEVTIPIVSASHTNNKAAHCRIVTMAVPVIAVPGKAGL